MAEDSNFLTKKKFSQMVEKESRLIGSYMDTIIHLCEQHGIEVEDVKKYLTPPIKERLEAEAMHLNMVEKPNGLPLV